MLIIYIENNIANEMLYNHTAFLQKNNYTTVITQIYIYYFQGILLFDMQKISIQYLWILVYKTY